MSISFLRSLGLDQQIEGKEEVEVEEEECVASLVLGYEPIYPNGLKILGGPEYSLHDKFDYHISDPCILVGHSLGAAFQNQVYQTLLA